MTLQRLFEVILSKNESDRSQVSKYSLDLIKIQMLKSQGLLEAFLLK